jgi:hypothetical protein
MSRSYFCPHCRKLLNPGTKVVFLVENGADMELVLLSSTLGDYSVVHSRSMEMLDGAVYTFRCPLCRADLTSANDHRFVELLSRDSDDEPPVRVGFSRIHGEHATFLMAENGIDQYGEHADRYDDPNFFGEAKNSNRG